MTATTSNRVWGLLLLAVPFIVVVILLRGLQVHLDTFHSADETYCHYPTILAFSENPDFFQTSRYESATTPLFHYFFAQVGRFVGFELWKLRALNVLLSYLVILLFCGLLEQWSIIASFRPLPYAMLSLLSPYFFGNSFIVTTDSLALLLSLATLLSLSHFLQHSSVLAPVVLAISVCLATLTRQTSASLALIAGTGIWVSESRATTKWVGSALLILALLPLATFVLRWGGFVPPHYQEWHVQTSLVPFRPFLFALALVGLYSTFFEYRRYLTILTDLRERSTLLISAIVGFALLLLFPLAEIDDNGYLWTIASWFPPIGGCSVLFWILVPLGLYTITSQCRENRRNFYIWFAVFCLVLPFVLSKVIHQKYLDPLVLVAWSVAHAGNPLWDRRFLYGTVPLYFVFILYFVLALTRS